MRTAVVQTNPIFGSIEQNVNEALTLMESAGADLYVLPELFNTGYNFTSKEEVAQLSEVENGWTCKQVSSFAQKHSCYVVYGFAERADKHYNSAALIGPQGLIGCYRKVHLFDRENLFFTPGNLGFPVFDLPFGKLGIMVCFDWMFPESARTLALKGAHLIAHPSNLVMPYCPDAMVTRCLENRVFAATANRVGTEDRGGHKLTYIGKSEIVAPNGEIMVRLDTQSAGISVVDVDLERAKNKKINSFNDLFAGRQEEAYRLK